MGKAIAIDWTPVLWAFGVCGAVIMLLLGWIGFMIQEDKKNNQNNYQAHTKHLEKCDKRFVKHDKKFDKQHNEIKELGREMKELMLVIKPMVSRNSG